MKELIQQILEEARGLWRFRRFAIVTTWAVCVLGWGVVLWLPNRYEAAARVFVDPTSSLKPVIENLAVQQDVNSELTLVRQTLLSEAQLQKIIDSTGLGAKAVTVQQKAGLVNGLRDRISIALQGNGEQGNQNQSKVYTISYQDSNRDRSLKVVELLLKSFIAETLGGKREGAQQAQQFLEQQIKDYEQRLGAAEERLAEFKKKYVGMVPSGQQEDYFTRMQTELDAVKKAQTALNAAATRRDALQKQLRGEAPVAASGGGLVGINGQSVSGGGDTLSRIKETQAKLDDLLLRFTDKHPDVVATRQTLQDLKARRESELEALRRGDANAAALTGASSNPVYQGIQLALNQATIEVASAQADLRDHQEKVAELKKFVDTMPQVEAEYAQLNRDYSVTKAQYTALAERLEKARVGEEADASGAVRFEVIDPPTAAYNPVSPKRSLLLAAVLLVGIAAGIGLAFALNVLHPVYHSIKKLAENTGLQVLGSVSLSLSGEAMLVRKKEFIRYGLVFSILCAVFLVALLLGRYAAPIGKVA